MSASSVHAIDYGRSAAELAQIAVPALHDSGYTGAGVLVCLLDDGFHLQDRHQATRMIQIPPGYRRDFPARDTLVSGPNSDSHGLWTLACLGAKLPGQLVGAAPAPRTALARTEVESTELPVEMLFWGMGAEWADSLGADIISSSLGYNVFGDPSDSYTYADMNGHTTDVSRAAEVAASKGILVVNSAGNEGASPWRYIIAPADVNGDSLIAVGAVDDLGLITTFSSWGPSADGRVKPDLVALGYRNPLPSPTDTTGYIVNSGDIAVRAVDRGGGRVPAAGAAQLDAAGS